MSFINRITLMDRVYDQIGHCTKMVAPIFSALLAAVYPFFLDAFHSNMAHSASATNALMAVLCMAAAFAVPVVGMVAAAQWAQTVQQRRLAYAVVTAPTLYVFMGVVQYMMHSPIPDELIWCVVWAVAAIWALRYSVTSEAASPALRVGHWRIAHGMSGAILLIFVGFHLFNHLAGLLGPHAHATVMNAGREIYRARLIEPVLVAAMLFQVVTGTYLAWRWTSVQPNLHRVLQVASGFYLSVFILGHMNSVFIFARTYLQISTDWDFATGAPSGLIYDPWNIRLVPHYALGVFFVLAHLVSGLRGVLMAHGLDTVVTGRLWGIGLAVSTILAAAIIAGMCGIHVL